MKHAKRKFLFEIKKSNIPTGGKEIELKEIIGDSAQEILNRHKDHIVLLQTEDQLIKGYIQKCDSKYYTFPIPDLTLIYFSAAQRSYQISKGWKKEMLAKLDCKEFPASPPIHEIYDYFGAIFSVVTTLFTALESFINQLVPRDYKKEIVRSKCIEVYNYEQILKHLDFKTKVKTVIPEVTKRNYFLHPNPSNQLIWNLKEFRDELIHTKPDADPFVFKQIYTKALNFNYPKYIEAVAQYFNYHKPNYIEVCDCGAEW